MTVYVGQLRLGFGRSGDSKNLDACLVNSGEVQSLAVGREGEFGGGAIPGGGEHVSDEVTRL